MCVHTGDQFITVPITLCADSLTRFGVYDKLKLQLRSPSDGATLPGYKLALAASVAGGLGGVAGL